MTDTDVDVDDVFDTTEDEDDEVFDLENIYPPEGDYEVTVLSVAYRNGVSKNSGKNAIGLNIRLQMTGDEAGDFSGTFLTTYLYLGEDKPMPRGLQKMQEFLKACGIESSGKFKLSDWNPQWKQIGKQREKVLTIFDNLVIGAHLKPEERDGDEGGTDVRVTYFLSADQLDARRNALTGDADF